MRRVFSGVLIIVLILSTAIGCGIGNIDMLSQRGDQDREIEIENNVGENVESDTQLINDVKPSVPQKGGTLSVSIPQLDTLNPLLTQSKRLISFFGLIYEGMFKLDQNLKPIPALVDKWIATGDGKVWTFQLKKGVKWHNGLELTAEDVKFTFDILRDYPDATNSYYGQSLFKNANIVSFEVAEDNPYVIIVTLSQPTVNLCALMTFPILPKYVYQSLGMVAGNHKIIDMGFLVGTGPYKVDAQNSDGEKQIKLVRNPEWWGKEPYIDSIIVKIYKDNEEERRAFENGELDLLDTHVLFAENYAMKQDTRLYRYLTQNYDFIAVNFRRNTHLLDKRVRQAIAYGLDRKDIISRVYFNNSLAVDVPIPLDSWLYSQNLRIYDYQPEKSIEILTSAGWSNLDEDIYFERMDGDEITKLSFTLIVDEDNSIRKDVARIIQKQLSIIGIRVELQFLPKDKIEEVLRNGNFEAVLAGYNLDHSGNLDFMFHSSRKGNGLNNFIGYANEDLDALLDEAKTTIEQNQLISVYENIQAHLIKELPFISLYFRTNSLIVKDKVKGITAPRDMNIYNNIEEWYIVE